MNNFIPIKRAGGEIKKMEEGGVADAAKRFIPVYGSYLDIKDAINNPTFGNIATAGMSTVGDVITLGSLGAGTELGAGLKALSAGWKTTKYVNAMAKAARANELAKGTASGTEAATKAARLASEARNIKKTAAMSRAEAIASGSKPEVIVSGSKPEGSWIDRIVTFFNTTAKPIAKHYIKSVPYRGIATGIHALAPTQPAFVPVQQDNTTVAKPYNWLEE